MSEQIYVIGYARVSSPKQAQTGESLQVQEEKIRKYCAKNGYTLFPDNTVFQEPYSGSNLSRPVYKEILELIKKQNKNEVKIKYLIFWDFDRLTRGGTEDYEQIWRDVSKYGVRLKDTTDIIQEDVDLMDEFGFDFTYKWAFGRKSEDQERQKAEDARKQKRKIIQTLILPEIRLTIDGYHIGRPDEGYVNKQIFVDNKKKCIQSPDPERFQFIVDAFKMRAEGLLSDEEICEVFNNKGYKTPLMRRWDKTKQNVTGTLGGNPMTIKHLQKIIKRTTYCGVICEKWTKYQPVKAKYAGLVSIDLFNKANRGKVHIEEIGGNQIILDRNVSVHSKRRKKYNPQFPIKGILMCDVCKKPFKASASKSKNKKYYGAYHCERGHKRVSYSQKEAEEGFYNYINKLEFSDDFLSILERVLIFKFRKKEGELAQKSSEANSNVAELEMQKSNLIKSFSLATVDVLRKGIEEQIVELQNTINRAKATRKSIELSEEDITDYIASSKDLMEHPAKMLENITSQEELLAVFSLIFEEFPTYSEIASGTPKLTLVLRVNKQKKTTQDSYVTLRGIEPRLQE
jgi:site-specific DNA recombinase